MRKRNKSITVRMTKDEYHNLQEKLEQTGQTQQAFVVNAIAGALITTPAMALELGEINISMAELIKQLRGMATNINQLARKANSYMELPTVETLERINDEVEEYRKEASGIWQLIRQLLSRQKHTAE